MTATAESYPEYETRPRRRGRKLLIGLLVLLLVLGGLLVLADRVAAGAAERAIAEQAGRETAKRQISSTTPDVSIGGFPFLTQVLDGRYESITINVRDAQGPVQDRTVRLPRLEITARDVTASLSTLRSGQGDVRAASVDGTGVIAYDSVAQFISQPGVKLAERDGKLGVSLPVDLLGQQFTVNGIGVLTVDDQGRVSLKFEDLNAEGVPNVPLARSLLTGYAKRISIRVPLPELPYDLRVREVRVLPEGLEVSATAKDVPLNAA
ncbi:LmeA family phospholipid-binding protein [Micromonospora echinofusca]|uniref:LmeA family phospholipid-binding protein n=1 Tax=Micromonospora echinofusca TaxID=47858 RepID=UPI0027DBC7F5|nr:DUF2993 domain-containing protein [Micromonospora echinofusca]